MQIKIIDRKIEKRFKNLSMNFIEEFDSYELNQRTVKLIIDALYRGGVDNRGEVWISRDKIIHILRDRSVADANYDLRVIRSTDIFKQDKETFIKLAPLMEILYRKSASKPNNETLKAVIEILTKVNFDPVVEGEKEKYQKYLKEQLPLLGKVRVKLKNITKDELTGQKLNKKFDFHHIRARGVLGNEIYQLDIELGLVLNIKTHKEITKENIKDEDDLYKFCLEKGYNLNWYEIVKQELDKYK